MLDKNKVVVIIPAFKAKNYLEQVLLRVLEQGYGNILVVDDCCPEETFRVVENHNVNVLKLDVNKGVGGAFLQVFTIFVTQVTLIKSSISQN